MQSVMRKIYIIGPLLHERCVLEEEKAEDSNCWFFEVFRAVTHTPKRDETDDPETFPIHPVSWIPIVQKVSPPLSLGGNTTYQ